MMNKRKADASNIGSKTLELFHVYQSLFVFDSNKYNGFGQCFQCRSDYMKFSFKGFCQRCLQKVEFISREHPQVLRKIKGDQSNG